MKMARSKKGSKEPSGRGAAATSRPSKKRLRLKTSEDEEEEQEKEEREEEATRGGGAVRRRRGVGEVEEEGNSSRRGSSRGAGSSKGTSDLKARSAEEVKLLALVENVYIWCFFIVCIISLSWLSPDLRLGPNWFYQVKKVRQQLRRAEAEKQRAESKLNAKRATIR